ncbi:MAG: colanic acid biosynthesis glycosyl transferase WcaI [Gaiellaceae bacterium]|jgi:glycosyltransferase involved in cell wall biosynthesis|nr:colanic acid biosynthesis glycosyl transferase WcaI [Gaiellaceae bacterium]
MSAAPRPRILVLNQYYWPGVEATGQLLSQLCADLANEYTVRVITGRLALPGAEAGRTLHEGVEIVRVNSTAFPRRILALRAFNYLTYLSASARAAAVAPRPNVVLCMTDPPVVAIVALAAARRSRASLVVISQDVFPEIAVLLHRIESSIVVGALRVAIRVYLKRADRVVAIGETMRRRLEAKGAPPERLRVIPNWVDTTFLEEKPRDNDWARDAGLTSQFVVMHSGNVGYTQDLDTLVRSATFLRDLDRLTIAIVGDGARRSELMGLAELLEVDRLRFFRYQSREALPYSLSSAHVHVIGLAPGLSGYVVPSRLYGVLAVGRPVIAAADADSETAELITRTGCGVVVPPGRPELLAAAIRRAHDGEYDLDEMGRRAREFAVTEADRRVAVKRYRELLAELTGGRG